MVAPWQRVEKKKLHKITLIDIQGLYVILIVNYRETP